MLKSTRMGHLPCYEIGLRCLSPMRLVHYKHLYTADEQSFMPVELIQHSRIKAEPPGA